MAVMFLKCHPTVEPDHKLLFDTTQPHAAGSTATPHQLSRKLLNQNIAPVDLLTTMSIWSTFPGHERALSFRRLRYVK